MENSKIKEFFKENFVLIIILLFGFILRLYYLILTKSQAVWWDEGEYLSMGLHWFFNIPYDLKEFGIQNGFLYDYIKFAPGPVVSSQTQLISQLQTRNPDKFRTRRRILRRLIYQHPDNLACSRVCRLIDWSLYAQNR